MRILHYTLGLPPYRSGGLTKYTYDLMKEQVINNDELYLLFPGHIKLTNKKVDIKFYKEVEKIKVYELINPLPVPLMNGVKNPEKFMAKADISKYIDFIKKINPEIINIHTLMGLHKEFLIAANKLNIPILYTTHDYYGLCMRVNFLNSDGKVCEQYDIEKCVTCNKSGESIEKIIIQQSRVYRKLKNYGIIERLKNVVINIRAVKKVTDNNKRNNKSNRKQNCNQKEKINYYKLLEYYKDMFNLIDKFIFNSSISKDVFDKQIKVSGEITYISHNDIKDKRILKDYSGEELRLTYLGPNKYYKGYYLLKKVMEKLNEHKYSNIKLNIYGKVTEVGEISDNIFSNGGYDYNQLEKIFNKTDLLIVPSIWKETFGFIVLEALSYGVPILVTSCVGSKDLIKEKNRYGIIVNPNEDDIFNELVNLNSNREILKKINKNIVEDGFEYLLSNHYKVINRIYKEEKSKLKNERF